MKLEADLLCLGFSIGLMGAAVLRMNAQLGPL
jgi:hypothetical protein